MYKNGKQTKLKKIKQKLIRGRNKKKKRNPLKMKNGIE